MGFAPLPAVPFNNSTPASPFVGVKSLWISKNAKDPALCADILKFYTNKENQLAMIAKTGEVPANLAAEQDSLVTSNPVAASYTAQAQNGVPLPNTPYMSALWDPLGKALTAIWTGAQTPDAALTAAQSAAEAGIKGIQS